MNLEEESNHFFYFFGKLRQNYLKSSNNLFSISHVAKGHFTQVISIVEDKNQIIVKATSS